MGNLSYYFRLVMIGLLVRRGNIGHPSSIGLDARLPSSCLTNFVGVDRSLGCRSSRGLPMFGSTVVFRHGTLVLADKDTKTGTHKIYGKNLVAI